MWRGTAAATLAALALGGFATSATAASTAARPADSFVDSIGINLHTDDDETAYFGHLASVKQRLQELGVRHVRDILYPDSPDHYQAINELADGGIKSLLILGRPDDEESVLDKLVATVKNQLAGSVDGVEGPNEYSTNPRHGDDWATELRDYQERLWKAIQDDPALSSLPVVGPSIVHNDQAALGDISSLLDYGNIHSYPEAEPPEYKMGAIVERAELNSKTKPIMATETGYTTATNWTPAGKGENRPISEQAMATYVPRLFFEYFTRHIARTYSYELLDQVPDPSLEDREAHFGLLHNDFSEKPAFAALRNTIDVLEDPGPAFTPESLDFTLDDKGTSDLHKALLQKRDGSFYLALWRLQSVWDAATKTPLTPAAEPVTIDVEGGYGVSAEYRPTSAQPIASFAPTASTTVDVGAGVTILKLTPIMVTVLPPTTNDRPTDESPPPGPPEPGDPQCVVPKLAGRKLASAKQGLRREGCSLGKVTKLGDATATTGKVTWQNPKPGKHLAAGTKVNVRLR